MLTINAIHGLIHTVSTFLILALAVQATPLPASNSAQLVPRDVLVEPSTSIRSYDVVHSTHSHNSFDLSGILPRMNTPIKTASSHPHEEEVSHLTSSLDDLGKRAEAALRDKQVRLFATLLAQIHEYLSPYVSGHDSKIPSNVHDLAQQIYNNLMKKWDGGDKKDVVKPSGEVNVSHIHFTNREDFTSGSAAGLNLLPFRSRSVGSIGRTRAAAKIFKESSPARHSYDNDSKPATI
ncbi:hypothetical protein H0H93_001154 [Arthromyces matolae]|nr:hypothetical protein H0H93_001154 [Arthromyces matolae]